MYKLWSEGYWYYCTKKVVPLHKRPGKALTQRTVARSEGAFLVLHSIYASIRMVAAKQGDNYINEDAPPSSEFCNCRLRYSSV